MSKRHSHESVLEVSGRAEEEGKEDDAGDLDLGVGGSLEREAACLQGVTDGDVAIDGEEHGEPGVDEAHDVNGRDGRRVRQLDEVRVRRGVLVVLEEQSEGAHEQPADEHQRVRDGERLRGTTPESYIL